MPNKQIHIPWTEEDKNYLRQNYINSTADQMSKELHRTPCSIRSEMVKLGLYKNKPWTKNDEAYLIKNYYFSSVKELSMILKRSEGSIRAKCYELRLVKKDEWSKEECDYLLLHYQDMTTKDIAQKLGRSITAINIHAKKMGLKKYPYHCNYNYFSNIDSEEKAYWLGFISADGWINKNKSTGSSVLGIELQYGDISHLKKFNKCINGNYQISDRWRSCSLSPYKKKNHTCVLRIFSIEMYNDLLKLGINNNKSYSFNIPSISQEYESAYFRGYFDGDGWISVPRSMKSDINDGYFKCGFGGAAKEYMLQLQNLLLKNGIKCTIHKEEKDNYATFWRIDILHSNNNIYHFLDWMYLDANIYLERKYRIYKQICKCKKYLNYHISLAN